MSRRGKRAPGQKFIDRLETSGVHVRMLESGAFCLNDSEFEPKGIDEIVFVRAESLDDLRALCDVAIAIRRKGEIAELLAAGGWSEREHGFLFDIREREGLTPAQESWFNALWNRFIDRAGEGVG